MVGIDMFQKKDPYYNPGYTGYCPQNKFVCGKTVADASQFSLLNPDINHAEKLALVDNKKDVEVVKPTKSDLNMVKERENRTDARYKHPMLSTYAGFVPNMGLERDRPFGVLATQAIANFERDQLHQKKERDHLKKIVDLQSGSKVPKNLGERLLLDSKFKLPLIAVRPERAGFQKNQPIDENFVKPNDYSTSPYFMDNENPEKFFINGYTGYIPFRYSHIGKPNKRASGDGLRDFTSNYLEKKITEWAPIIISKEKKYDAPHVPVTHTEIYKKDTALMPTYTGHVPGASEQVGKTFGKSSMKAHAYLEETLFLYNMKKFKIPPEPKQK